jgi:hypothetical protein
MSLKHLVAHLSKWSRLAFALNQVAPSIIDITQEYLSKPLTSLNIDVVTEPL